MIKWNVQARGCGVVVGMGSPVSLPSSPTVENVHPSGHEAFGRDEPEQLRIQSNGGSAVPFLPALHLLPERRLPTT